jgi:hypothetical protein
MGDEYPSFGLQKYNFVTASLVWITPYSRELKLNYPKLRGKAASALLLYSEIVKKKNKKKNKKLKKDKFRNNIK